MTTVVVVNHQFLLMYIYNTHHVDVYAEMYPVWNFDSNAIMPPTTCYVHVCTQGEKERDCTVYIIVKD